MEDAAAPAEAPDSNTDPDPEDRTETPQEEAAEAPTLVPEPAPAVAVPAAPEGAAVQESPLVAVERAAAAALAEAYKALPGVVSHLISGETVTDVKTAYAASQKAYADIKADILRDLAGHIPGGNGGAGVPPAPATPFEAIKAGLSQPKQRG